MSARSAVGYRDRAGHAFGGLSISAEFGHGGMMRRGDAFTLLVEIIIMVIVVLVMLSIVGLVH
ncbi:MAG TPA: hypothetical protein VF003_06615 [Pseudonocardiaceae bacterium]